MSEPAKQTAVHALVQFDAADGIGWINLNNPVKRNALSSAMMAALKEQLERVQKEPGIRVVVIRAHGPVFSAGHDLRELIGQSRTEYEAIFALCSELMETIRTMPQPVIAEVRGLATAAGCQLVAACDLAVASSDAQFATPGVKIGLFCTTPGVAVARAVPRKKAMEMLLTGEPIDAVEAERAGLINRVVPESELAETTQAMATRIAAASPVTVGLGKRAFYEQVEMDILSAYRYAQSIMADNLIEADASEGIQAFLEKRPPRWQS